MGAVAILRAIGSVYNRVTVGSDGDVVLLTNPSHRLSSQSVRNRPSRLPVGDRVHINSHACCHVLLRPTQDGPDKSDSHRFVYHD